MSSSCESARRSRWLICVPFLGEPSDREGSGGRRSCSGAEKQGPARRHPVGQKACSGLRQAGRVCHALYSARVTGLRTSSSSSPPPPTHTPKPRLTSWVPRGPCSAEWTETTRSPTECSNKPTHPPGSRSLSFLPSHIYAFIHLLPICPNPLLLQITSHIYLPVCAFIHSCYLLIRTRNPSYL